MTTEKSEMEETFEVLKAPDLSTLMSEILSKSDPNQRLVFVEYDPATCAFYDHVGIPQNQNSDNNVKITQEKARKSEDSNDIKNILKNALKKSGSCKIFLENLFPDMNKYLETCPVLKKMFIKLKEKFPKELADIAEHLLVHKYGRESDIILEEEIAEMEKMKNYQKRFLVCLARSKNPKEHDPDIKWLKKFCEVIDDKKVKEVKEGENDQMKLDDLYQLFHWLFQQTPQHPGKGGCGNYLSNGWKDVVNTFEEVEGFPAATGLEILFGMRVHRVDSENAIQGKKHARINIFLDTGEYVGQMIAFTTNDDNDKHKKELLEKSVKAARLMRRILPEVRYARYMKAILAGQATGVPDHVVVRYLPYVLPLEKFYMRISKEENDNTDDTEWEKFWEGAAVHSHKKKNDDDFFNHFEPKKENDSDSDIIAILKKKGKMRNGFVSYEFKDGILLGFTIDNSTNLPGKNAVIAVVDKKLLPPTLFNDLSELTSNQEEMIELKKNLIDYGVIALFPTKDNYEYNDYLHKDIPDPEEPQKGKYNLQEMLLINFTTKIHHELRRKFYIHITTNLSIILEPRHPLEARLVEAKKEGKPYNNQYGASIYGTGYLDVENIDSKGLDKELCLILKHIRHTKKHLVDILFEPRGYRAIARVIFDEFFEPLWKYFGFTPKNPLWKLLNNALDFEDTLRLESGYREHFVHSYHTFLLGLYIIRQLGLTKRFTKEDYKAWFLVSMYHDVGYPIQEMEEIAKKYLERLNMSEESRVGDDMSIDVKIGYGKLLASGLFGARLKVITDNLVDKLFVDHGATNESAARNEQVKKLEKYLQSHYNKNINWSIYKSGMNHTFYQYCLRLALNYGEHGIISALLFDSAARCLSSAREIKMRREVSVAILGHHMLDKTGKWPLTDHWTYRSNESEEAKPEQAITKEQAKEMARSIAWDPAFFAYELRKKSNNSCFLGTLLILCDTVSQWGRTDDEEDKKLALLRNRNNDEPLVVLCYPKMTDTGLAEDLLSHYESQLKYIAGPYPIKKVGFVTLKYNCSSYNEDDDKEITAEKCSECKENVVTVKGKQGTLFLTPKPMAFPDVIQAHETIDKDAEKKRKGIS